MVEIPKQGIIQKIILSGELTRLVVLISTAISVIVFVILAILSLINIIDFQVSRSNFPVSVMLT